MLSCQGVLMVAILPVLSRVAVVAASTIMPELSEARNILRGLKAETFFWKKMVSGLLISWVRRRRSEVSTFTTYGVAMAGAVVIALFLPDEPGCCFFAVVTVSLSWKLWSVYFRTVSLRGINTEGSKAIHSAPPLKMRLLLASCSAYSLMG